MGNNKNLLSLINVNYTFSLSNMRLFIQCYLKPSILTHSQIKRKTNIYFQINFENLSTGRADQSVVLTNNNAKLEKAFLKKYARRADQFVRRTINKLLHIIPGENQHPENLHDFSVCSDDLLEFPISFRFLCSKQDIFCQCCCLF